MSRRCLICANINPCRDHSEAEQHAELDRNDVAVKKLRQGIPSAATVQEEALRAALNGLVRQLTAKEKGVLDRICAGAPWKTLDKCPVKDLPDIYNLLKRTLDEHRPA